MCGRICGGWQNWRESCRTLFLNHRDLEAPGSLVAGTNCPSVQAMAAWMNQLQKTLCIFPLKTPFLGGFHWSSLGHMPIPGLREGREPWIESQQWGEGGRQQAADVRYFLWCTHLPSICCEFWVNWYIKKTKAIDNLSPHSLRVFTLYPR